MVPGCGRPGALEGYTRIPADDEFDGLAEANARILIGEEPW
jgi:hypothetical protein